MRKSVPFAIGLLTLLSSIASIQTVSAQEPLEPYFRRFDGNDMIALVNAQGPSAGAAITVPESRVPFEQLTDHLKIGACIDADRAEAFPGDDVRYVLCIKSLYRGVLPQFKMAFFFDPNQMKIIDAGGATFHGNNVAWTITPLQPGEVRKLTVKVHTFRNVKPGTKLRTYASMVWDGALEPACTKHDLLMIAKAPVTGAGDAMAPIEDLQQFIRPVTATSNRGVFSMLW